MATINDKKALRNFSRRMNALMRQRNITASDLARGIGENRMRISFYCRGKQMPGVGVAARIAAFFDVPLDDLLT